MARIGRALLPRGHDPLAIDDTHCRKRGPMTFGTGMHHDPRISSRSKPLVSWDLTGSSWQ